MDNMLWTSFPGYKILGTNKAHLYMQLEFHLIDAFLNFSTECLVSSTIINIIVGTRTDHQYNICELGQELDANTGYIFSPNYPYNNSHVYQSCHTSLSSRFQMIDYNITWTYDSSSELNYCGKTSVTLNGERLCSSSRWEL